MWKKVFACLKRNIAGHTFLGLMAGFLLHQQVISPYLENKRYIKRNFTLLFAAREGDLATVKSYYDDPSQYERIHNGMGWDYQKASILRYLLSTGKYFTPMDFAIGYASDTYASSRGGNTNHLAIVRYLSKKQRLGSIKLTHSTNMMKLLISLGAPFNIRDAVRLGDVNFIRRCLRGIVPNYFLFPVSNTNLQLEAIQAAMHLNKPDIVLLLHREAGYPLTGDESFGHHGGNMFTWSIENGNIELLKILLQKKRRVPKHFLCFAKDVQVARLLLQYGAEVNYPIGSIGGGDTEGNYHNATAIVYAIRDQKLELVKLFVEHGAAINFAFGAKDQHTPLSWSGNSPIANYLRSIGAKEKVVGIPPKIKQYREEKARDEKRIHDKFMRQASPADNFNPE